MQRAAIVARFHHGVLPTRRHKALRDLVPDEQKAVIQLAAVLRLANALDAAHDGRIRRVQIEANARAVGRRPLHEALVIAAEGYSANSPAAQTIAAERHLLETVLHRPVVIKPVPIKAAKKRSLQRSGIKAGEHGSLAQPVIGGQKNAALRAMVTPRKRRSQL